MSKSDYKITVGIECHVQLNTKTKLFSAVDNDAVDKEPNSCVSPIDYALPGMLPVLIWGAACNGGIFLRDQRSGCCNLGRKRVP